MAISPGATGYQLPDGTWVAPAAAFGDGENPYDPETQPALYEQWEFAHRGDARQIGQNYSPGRVGAIIGGTVAGGALGDYFAAGAGAGGAGASGGGSAVSGGAGAAAADSPYVLGVGTPAVTTGLPAGVTTTGVTTLATPAVATAAQAGTAPPSAPPTAPKPGSTLWGKIAPLLGLGVDAYGAYKGQQATNQATQQLVQAGQQAKADLSKVYGGVTPVLSQVVQRQQANLSPYLSLGSGAASLLGYGLGIPGVQAAPSGVYQPPTDPFGTSPSLRTAAPAPPNSMLAPTFQQGQSPFVPAVGQPPVQPFPQPGVEAVPSPTAQPASSLTPQMQTQSSYLMRAPTGELEQVPAAQRAWYESKGAVLA